MDGTLIDTEPYWIAAETALARSHGVEWSHEDGLQLVGLPLARSAQILIDAGVTLTVDEIVGRLSAEVTDAVRARVPWHEDSRRLLMEAHAAGIPCALVTMSLTSMAQVLVDAAGGVFETVVGGDQVSRGKPDPESYLLAADRLGVDVRQCVAIEDSPSGLGAAHASGAVTIGLRRLVPLPHLPGVVEVDSLEGWNVPRLAALLSARRDESGED